MDEDENIDINAQAQPKKDDKITMPIMLDVDSDDEDYDTIVDAALDKAPERDLVDLAGILGKLFCKLDFCDLIRAGVFLNL
jgi:hypothetical protein